MKVLIAAFILTMTGCATVPPPAEIKAGDVPTAGELAAAIQKELRRTLKDYDSVKDFELIEGPTNAHAIYGMGGVERLWFACARFNAKNSYGGYAGPKNYPMYFRRVQGDVIHVAPIGWRSVSRTC